MNDHQNAFQNAGQNGNFYYTAIANQSSTFLVLILALIMLVAMLRSEQRYRKLLEDITSCSRETDPK
jgi:predicted PurR-regulated permease PerM